MLQSAALPLLLPTPNAIGAIGANRERWVLHPRAGDGGGGSGAAAAASGGATASGAGGAGCAATSDSGSGGGAGASAGDGGSARQRDLLVFVGRLMGFALRNREFLPLSLAPLTWKAYL